MLFGWAWDIESLKSVLPGLVSMKANTALGFLLSGITLHLLIIPNSPMWARGVSRVLICCLMLLGSATLAEYAGNWDFGIDQRLFGTDHHEAFTVYPGRMSLFTALCFSTLAIAMWLIELRRHWVVAQSLALLSAVFPMLSLVGYMFGNLAILMQGNSSALAVHTAAAFLLVVASLLGLTLSHGLIARWHASLLKLSTAAAVLITLLAASAIFFGIGIRNQASLAAEHSYQDIAQLEEMAEDAHQSRLIFLPAAPPAPDRFRLRDRLAGNVLRAEAMALRNPSSRNEFNSLKSKCYELLSLIDSLADARRMAERRQDSRHERLVQEIDALTHHLGKTKLVQLKTNLDVLDTQTSAASLASGIAMSFALFALLIGGLRLRRELIDRKLAEQALAKLNLQANELMEQQVVAQTIMALAHELNQPLNAAASYSEAALRLIKADAIGTDKLAQILKLNVAEIRQAGKVLKDLLHHTHGADTVSETVELHGALNEAVQLFRRESYEHQPDIRLQQDGGECHVSASKLVLEKVLMNLLWNACQAASPATITIRTTPAADRVTVSVIDGGAALPAAIVQKLFSPFFTTKTHGMGLGLSISRALIESHQGKLWYEPVDGRIAFHFSLCSAPHHDTSHLHHR